MRPIKGQKKTMVNYKNEEKPKSTQSRINIERDSFSGLHMDYSGTLDTCDGQPSINTAPSESFTCTSPWAVQ